jgi:hypothetical protein
MNGWQDEEGPPRFLVGPQALFLYSRPLLPYVAEDPKLEHELRQRNERVLLSA